MINFAFKRASFLKNTSSFSLLPFPMFWNLKSGEIYANFSGEIVMSSSVLDHWVVISSPFMNHNDLALQITNSECI